MLAEGEDSSLVQGRKEAGRMGRAAVHTRPAEEGTHSLRTGAAPAHADRMKIEPVQPAGGGC